MKLFVPGRICLFGEHSDWAGGYRRVSDQIEKGYTLICGTEQGIYATVTPHPSALIVWATTPEGEKLGPYEIPMEAETLLEEARRGGFWSYAAGVAYQALTHYEVQGLEIDNYKTDLPIKKGLSSSAAISVLVARAFNQLYDLKLTIRGEMEMAYQGEVTTPSRCGRMDQGCAFGSSPVVMTFDGDYLTTVALRPSQDLHFVIVDLKAEKDTVKILSRLNQCYPRADDDIKRGVQDLLGPINQRIVHQAVDALQAGNARRLGMLMVEAQSQFDRYAMPACPEELTAPVLHHVLNYEPLQPYIWGGKGVGSQGDGAAQFVARSKADQEAAIDLIENELGMACLKLTVPGAAAVELFDAGAGAGLPQRPRVRKAVVPAAGLGTRLFPATKAVKKEWFPIVDRDGVAKPAIFLIVEEALNAGIEEVIIVVQPEDLKGFEELFSGKVPASSYDKLPGYLQAYAGHILDMGQRITFVLQTSQEGFGHAVFGTREAVGDEPFLLMLGDHLYRSNGDKACARQMLDAYYERGKSVLGLRRCPEQEIGSYGTAAGFWLEQNRMINVTELAEKPSIDYARASLRVPGLPEGEYLTLFGLYLLKPRIFEHLERLVASNMREGGEFQLTTALDRLRREDGFVGLIVDGHAYDIGLPKAYVEALLHLHQG